ncbi:MAG: hypothetical protein ACK5IA_05900, partial [Cyanobacteriota bacterium]
MATLPSLPAWLLVLRVAALVLAALWCRRCALPLPPRRLPLLALLLLGGLQLVPMALLPWASRPWITIGVNLLLVLAL